MILVHEHVMPKQQQEDRCSRISFSYCFTFSPFKTGMTSRRSLKLPLIWSRRLRSKALWWARFSAWFCVLIIISISSISIWSEEDIEEAEEEEGKNSHTKHNACEWLIDIWLSNKNIDCDLYRTDLFECNRNEFIEKKSHWNKIKTIDVFFHRLFSKVNFDQYTRHHM